MGRGESRTFTITVTSAAGDLVDLTDAQVHFVVRDLAGDVVLTKRSTAAGGSDEEIEIADQEPEGETPSETLGQCYLKLTTTDTDIEQTARWADCWVVTDGDPPEQLRVDSHAPFYITGDEPPAFV